MTAAHVSLATLAGRARCARVLDHARTCIACRDLPDVLCPAAVRLLAAHRRQSADPRNR
ncbi:hypothetical protein [Streptomyces aidingensis]|uniref:Uncharacterized protein n=1 Tax=Streptomyces aidingensis TaxID=910347 RepID=A0A1I1RJQ8_9ACTN|nr:hypothetical protein [Streptomyces aidingensis]SFD34362.1 hypothetical protein SAMN05421773_113131 [Streptomyces aidingensis]